ncbi:hypothetical protein [Chlorogloeopsis sp. ULAP02]|uniref:hypothetical protein n=1 Tax=Chlorogloeopsis sp. ULAP02 TaxID=3107926 RepID=UPI0031348C82
MPQLNQIKIWLVGGVTLVASLTVPVLAQKPPTPKLPTQQKLPTQNPPARTYNPGYWQPIARVNPKQAVTVILINETNSPLKYNFLDGRADNDLPVGGNAKLNNVTLPVNIAIYNPSQEAAAGKAGGLRYETSAQDNTIEVRVRPVDAAGYRVLNISKAGGVYAY